MKSQKKNKVTSIVKNIKLLRPKQKLVVLKALHDNKPLTDKDLAIMEWAVNAIKTEQKNTELLKEGLKVLSKAIERQNKKS